MLATTANELSKHCYFIIVYYLCYHYKTVLVSVLVILFLSHCVHPFIRPYFRPYARHEMSLGLNGWT